MLASTPAGLHGVASALLVVARMIGMLVGISVLTTLGLRHFYAVTARLPTPTQVCSSNTACDAYTKTIKEAGLAEMHGIFFGAMIAALVAGGLALLLFRDLRRSDTYFHPSDTYFRPSAAVSSLARWPVRRRWPRRLPRTRPAR
jgi:hypothetical protein